MAANVRRPRTQRNRPGPTVNVVLLDYAGIEAARRQPPGQGGGDGRLGLSCPPCVREFPKLVALREGSSKDQLACISLSFDYDGIGEPADKLERVVTFLKKQATFDNVLASEESDTLYRKFHLASVPAVFVYDKTGELRHRFDNEESKSEADHFTYDDVERLVTELVAEPEPAGEADAKP